MASAKAQTKTTKTETLFPFAPERMKEMFGTNPMEKFMENASFDALIAAQQKNVDAIVEANRVAFAGYQEVNTRLISIFEESFAQAKDSLAELQGKQISTDSAAESIEVMKSALENAVANLRELGELTQKANTGAFEVVKARVDEAMDEFRGAAEKIAA